MTSLIFSEKNTLKYLGQFFKFKIALTDCGSYVRFNKNKINICLCRWEICTVFLGMEIL